MFVWVIGIIGLVLLIFLILFEVVHYLTTILIESIDIDFDEEELQDMCKNGLRNLRWEE
jgi:hypothetical protein